MRKSLTKAEILRDKAVMRRLFDKRAGGEEVFSCSARGIKMLAAENGGASRYLFAPVRGVGGAVKRNRCKRLVREVVRLNKGRIRTGFDCAFIIFPCERDGFHAREKQFHELARRFKKKSG